MSAIDASKVLETLDAKRFSFFHVKMIVISGMGFFTDAYDLFTIGMLTQGLGRIYFQDNPYYVQYRVRPGKIPLNLNAAVTSVALCGTLAGQVFFGYLGDRCGRRAVYGLSLAIMIFCAVGQSMTFGYTSHAMVGTICFWRFMLGCGIGGDYPLSATIMSEYSSRSTRGAYIGSVFAMQGVGYLVASAIVAIIGQCFAAAYPCQSFPDDVSWVDPRVTSVSTWQVAQQAFYYNQLAASCVPEFDFAWRCVLCIGSVPAAATMYFRLHMKETPRYTLHIAKNAAAMQNDMAIMLEHEDNIARVDEESAPKEHTSYGDEDISFGGFLSKYFVQLLGCTMCWFLLDVAFYSQGLFQSQVFLAVGFLPPSVRLGAVQELQSLGKAQAIIALGSTIPGYWATVFTVDTLGRKFIQFMGFIIMTALMSALAGTYFNLLNPNNRGGNKLNPQFNTNRNGWICMYAFCFFFANFGPNSTTFIVPAELFPTKWKATGHGMSAAWGKAGAIIGSYGFLFAANPQRLELFWSQPCQYEPSDFYWYRTNGVTGPQPDAADGKIIWQFNSASYPSLDFASFVRGGCILTNNCPTGRVQINQFSGLPVPASIAGQFGLPTVGGVGVVGSNGVGPFVSGNTWGKSGKDYPIACDICQPDVLSGCYPFGIGVPGALGILAGTNFLGMCFTFCIPETNQQSLEELNGEGPAKEETA